MSKELLNALNVIKSGGVILYPTDTIWGIGCDASSDLAAKKIFEIKKRDYSKGFICLASSFKMIKKYVDIVENDNLKKLSDEAPTTFIFNNPKKISKYVTANENTIGFRIPKNNFCMELINMLGRPIVSTSANISGDKIPLNYNLISSEIKEKVDYIVKHEDKNRSSESRIFKLKNDGGFSRIR